MLAFLLLLAGVLMLTLLLYPPRVSTVVGVPIVVDVPVVAGFSAVSSFMLLSKIVMTSQENRKTMDRFYSISYFSFFIVFPSLVSLRFASFQFNFASNFTCLFSMRKMRGKSTFSLRKEMIFASISPVSLRNRKRAAHPTSQ